MKKRQTSDRFLQGGEACARKALVSSSFFISGNCEGMQADTIELTGETKECSIFFKTDGQEYRAYGCVDGMSECMHRTF